ncbi:MAG: DUF6526 family protein [Candidatus Kapaibacterium sp.]
MKTQNAQNHAQFVPVFHFGLFSICVASFIIAGIHLFGEITLVSILLFLMAIALNLGFIFMRMFPLKVQDRAIRAEENLRHFALTGKLLDPALTMSQIIALRFASDSEFVALAERAVKESMSSKQIKQAVKQWRADYHRA